MKETTVSRLAGSAIFLAFGVLFVSLALTGRSDTAPGFQRDLGAFVGRFAVRLGEVPNTVAWPVLAAVVALLAYVVFKPRGERVS
mgnify:FL=1